MRTGRGLRACEPPAESSPPPTPVRGAPSLSQGAPPSAEGQEGVWHGDRRHRRRPKKPLCFQASGSQLHCRPGRRQGCPASPLSATLLTDGFPRPRLSEGLSVLFLVPGLGRADATRTEQRGLERSRRWLGACWSRGGRG